MSERRFRRPPELGGVTGAARGVVPEVSALDFERMHRRPAEQVAAGYVAESTSRCCIEHQWDAVMAS